MARHVGSTVEPTARERRTRPRPLLRGSGREPGPDIDVLFDVLAARRRRIVLDYLRDREGERVSVESLADRIAGWEVELYDPASVSTESIEIDLVHGHLPKLEQAGLVDFDGQRVRYRGDDRVERFLDLSRREGPFP